MNSYLILGASSAVAQKFCEQAIKNGSKLVLVGRNERKLTSLKNHYNTISDKSILDIITMDFNNVDETKKLILSLEKWKIENTLCCWGFLGNDKLAQTNPDHALEIIQNNFTSYISVISSILPYYDKLNQGSISVITSVAGERGRQSNYTYGTAKGALSIYLEGLRHRLAGKNINILDIKPGFIDTPMTANFKKGLLWVKPEKVANDIHLAIAKSRREIYTPFFWRYIMLVIKNIPFFIFKKIRI